MPKWFSRLFRRKCDHGWIDQSLGKRSCVWCGQRQMLFWNRFPEVGEPSMVWRDLF